MFNAIKKIFAPKWKHKRNLVINDELVREEVYNKGYSIVGNIGATNIEKLEKLFSENHNFEENNEGGMFYSVYSQDLAYRETVHKGIKNILTENYNKLFNNYKTIINSFIVKLAGPNSQFYLHQDSTGLDELTYSPLSVWIPLEDVNEENGCLFFVPKSHQMASPYRSISFQQAFENIKEDVLEYAVPIEMKAGEILIFDNRILHNSSSNSSKKARVVAMSGVFPKEAKILAVYKDTAFENSPLEIYEQKEDFLLKNKNLYIDCTLRPKLGVKTKEIDFEVETWSKKDFEDKCLKLGISKANKFAGQKGNINCKIIAEPNVG